MKGLITLTIGLVLVSCEDTPIEHNAINIEEENIEIPCSASWEDFKPTQEELDFEVKNGIVAERPNDSTILQIRYGRVWFEMINPTTIDGGASKCYLKTYRPDGTLESEGYGIYYEHPVADYSMDGIWKFYTCDEILKEEVEFRNGVRIKN